jgi:SHS2 domain-containing protein
MAGRPPKLSSEPRKRCDRHNDRGEAARGGRCRLRGADLELLLVERLNAIIYEMAVRKMVFSRVSVAIQGAKLTGQISGERVDRAPHAPACEAKGRPIRR